LYNSLKNNINKLFKKFNLKEMIWFILLLIIILSLIIFKPSLDILECKTGDEEDILVIYYWWGNKRKCIYLF